MSLKTNIEELCMLNQKKKKSTCYMIPFISNSRKCKLMYSDGKSVFLRRKGAGRRVGTMKGYKEILGSNEF